MNYQKILNNLIYSVPFYTDKFCKEVDFTNYSFDDTVLKINVSNSDSLNVGYPITVLFLRKIEILKVENINNCLRLKNPEELKNLFINGVEVGFTQYNNNFINLFSDINLTPTTIVQTLDLAYLSTTSEILTKNGNEVTINYNKVIESTNYTLYKVYANHKIEFIASIDNLNYYIEKKDQDSRLFILPLQSVSSRSIHSVTDAVTEQEVGTDFVQTRINNFSVLMYIPIDAQTKGAVTTYLIKNKYIPAVISSLAGLKLDNSTSPIVYKQDNLTVYNNSYIIYNIDFEFTDVFGKKNIIVNQEFLAKDFNILGSKND